MPGVASRAGRLGLIRVALTSASTAYPVSGVSDFTFDQSGQLVTDTELLDAHVTRIANLHDAKLAVSGGRRASDTGQQMLLSALSGGTSLYVLVRPATALETAQLMLITKFTTDVAIDGRAEFSCELEGTGATEQDVSTGIAIGTQADDKLTTQAGDILSTQGSAT